MSLEKLFKRFGSLTEKYTFYNGEVELRYNVKDHRYLLLLPDGTLEPQDGVTSICHIIDKSDALIPWACKMMAAKLLVEVNKSILPTGEVVVPQQTMEDFEKLVLGSKDAHNDKLEDAANVGHMAHNWIEQYIKAVLKDDEPRKLELLAKFPTEPRAQNCCVAALEWMQKHNVRWIHTERKVYSRMWKFAGTMDGLCLVDSCDDTKCRGCGGREPWKDHLTIADWKSSNYLYLEYLYQTAAYMRAYFEETDENVTDRWVIRLGKEDGEFDPWYAPMDTFPDDWNGFRLALELSRQVAATTARIDALKSAERAVRKAEKVQAKITKEAEKAAAKAEKAVTREAERTAALKIKCKKANAYKGFRAPKCNGGQPCEACLKIYEARKAHSPRKETEETNVDPTHAGPTRIAPGTHSLALLTALEKEASQAGRNVLGSVGLQPRGPASSDATGYAGDNEADPDDARHAQASPRSDADAVCDPAGRNEGITPDAGDGSTPHMGVEAEASSRSESCSD